MAKYAHIRDGEVVEIVEPMEGFAIEDCYHPDVAEQLVELSAQSPAPEAGWRATQTGRAWSFQPPAPVAVPAAPPAPTLTELHAQLKDLQGRIEQALAAR